MSGFGGPPPGPPHDAYGAPPHPPRQIGPGPFREAPHYEQHRSATILALGIVSVVLPVVGFMCCLPVGAVALAVGIPGIVMGRRDLRKMAQGKMDPRGHDQTNIGVILSIVGSSIAGLVLLVTIILAVLYGGLVGFALLSEGMH